MKICDRTLSSAHLPTEQNFWCHREEYGKRQVPRRKSLDTQNLRGKKEQKKERKVRHESGENSTAAKKRFY
jgi:hypothetical protein